jgi:hypothetical protein
MANVTAQRSTKRLHVPAFEYEVEMTVRSGVTLYAGAMVGIDSTGALNKAGTAGNTCVLGRLKHPPKDGYIVGDGVKRARVECGVLCYNNSGTDAVDADDVGKLCFVEDDQTVSETGSTTAITAGIVFALNPPGASGQVAVIQGLENRLAQLIVLNATGVTGASVR